MSGQPFQLVPTAAQHQESAGTSPGREPGDQLSPAAHSTDEERKDRQGVPSHKLIQAERTDAQKSKF